MFGIKLKHSLATVAVAAGVLAAAGPASAGTHQSPAFAYQHNQSDFDFLAASSRSGAAVEDRLTGTSVIESIGTKYTMFFLPEIGDEVL